MNGSGEIIINDRKIGLKFGLPAIRLIAEKAEPGFTHAETYSTIILAQIIHAGHRNYCLVKEIEPVIDFEEIFDFVEDCGVNHLVEDEIKKAVKIFEDSKHVKKGAEAKKEMEEAEKKSLLTGTILNEKPMENSGLVLNSTAG